MADIEVPTEMFEGLEAVFEKLIQELDMANLDNCCHLAEEGSCVWLLTAFISPAKLASHALHGKPCTKDFTVNACPGVHVIRVY